MVSSAFEGAARKTKTALVPEDLILAVQALLDSGFVVEAAPVSELGFVAGRGQV